MRELRECNASGALDATRRRLLLTGIDVSAWAIAITTVTWFRLARDATYVDAVRLLCFILLVLAMVPVVGMAARLYQGRVGGIEESVRLAWVALLTGVLAAAMDFVVPLVPQAIPMNAALVAVVIGWSARQVIRRDYASTRRVIVFGAGDTGERLARSMMDVPDCGYQPVAFLDDAPVQRVSRIGGVPVRGTRHDIAKVAARTGASLLVLAVPSVDAEVLRAAHDAGLEVLALPDDAPEADVADLHVLDAVAPPAGAVREHLAGKRVLVTGAAGTIGAELSRQIHQAGPARLFLLDRDVPGLHDVRGSIGGADVLPVDIRDSEAVRGVFARCLPEVVLHAAAFQHGRYPLEAWRTNVLGTYYVLEAALSAGVRTFVNISADEAADATCVLGRSERIGERLTADAAARSGGEYLSVRLGDASPDAVRQVLTQRPAGVAAPPLDPAHLLSLALGDNEIAAMTECAGIAS
ncbi:dTDP-glucose 4,6-dehydratase [Lentzea sp. NBRC 105346]|uniref:polysaccharide biosynthesis protein n=1 Tax=Lentzea sp. NBRC 105346 TaxID=3032205 RepID=UPI0024A29213|nr:polysaccharide biosynthesis protein [Lentzea sp. NBRC 105346]GLZ30106.1 dTDP-glucose 4,6-dehydratase [Lentzea sp. NBRC 105346]